MITTCAGPASSGAHLQRSTIVMVTSVWRCTFGLLRSAAVQAHHGHVVLDKSVHAANFRLDSPEALSRAVHGISISFKVKTIPSQVGVSLLSGWATRIFALPNILTDGHMNLDQDWSMTAAHSRGILRLSADDAGLASSISYTSMLRRRKCHNEVTVRINYLTVLGSRILIMKVVQLPHRRLGFLTALRRRICRSSSISLLRAPSSIVRTSFSRSRSILSRALSSAPAPE